MTYNWIVHTFIISVYNNQKKYLQPLLIFTINYTIFLQETKYKRHAYGKLVSKMCNVLATLLSLDEGDKNHGSCEIRKAFF